jgi:hypothetical protein
LSRIWTPERKILLPDKIRVPKITYGVERLDPFMAAAVVAAGAAVQSSAANTAASPAYGATPTAGNVLVLLASGAGTASTLPATPAGWTLGPSVATLAHSCAAIYFKLAAGSDAAPTLAAAAGMLYAGILVEVSGLDTTTMIDKQGSGGNSAATSPLVVANSTPSTGVDAAAGEFFCSAAGLRYSAAAIVTKTNTFNNGATATSAFNGGSTANHYGFGYGITTGNAAADQNSFSWSTAVNAQAVSMVTASFLLASVRKSLMGNRRRHQHRRVRVRS